MDEANTRPHAALASDRGCRLTLPLRAELRFLSSKWKFSNFAISSLRSLYPHRPITHKTEHLWLILIAWLLLSSLKIIWRGLNATACILGSANCIFALTRNVIYYWFRTNVHILSMVCTMSVSSFSLLSGHICGAGAVRCLLYKRSLFLFFRSMRIDVNFVVRF